MQFAYLSMLAWQVIWHGLLPPPVGTQSAWLTIITCVPLLIPLAGLLKNNYRSMIWAGLILMLYLAIGVMEAWGNPPQRAPALVQVALPILYLFAFRKRNLS